MHPIICTIGNFHIYSFGLMLVIAFFVSSFLVTRACRKEGTDPDLIFNALFIVFISGVIGARLFYVMYNLDYYLKNPLEIIMLQHGGLAWFGSLICGSIAGVIYLKIKKLKIIEVLDLVAPYVALGQAIGRIGCLLNGCCYGRESGFGIYFKSHDALLIPTQAYSSLALILIFFVLRFLQNKPHLLGTVFFSYLFLYSVKRFIIEFWRADSSKILAGLTLFQILSIVLFCFSAASLIFIFKKTKA